MVFNNSQGKISASSPDSFPHTVEAYTSGLNRGLPTILKVRLVLAPLIQFLILLKHTLVDSIMVSNNSQGKISAIYPDTVPHTVEACTSGLNHGLQQFSR